MTALEKDIHQFGREANLTGRERFKAWLKQITMPELRKLVEKTDSTKEPTEVGKVP